MAHFMVDKIFEQPLSDKEIELSFSQLTPCLNQYGVRWLQSFLSKDRKRMLCTFEAADAESLRMAHHIASVDYEKIWATDILRNERGEDITRIT
jgi:hypothetical protein